MDKAISRISSNMVSEIHMLADITVGKGLVTQNEIISAIDSELSYVIKNLNSRQRLYLHGIIYPH